MCRTGATHRNTTTSARWLAQSIQEHPDVSESEASQCLWCNNSENDAGLERDGPGQQAALFYGVVKKPFGHKIRSGT